MRQLRLFKLKNQSPFLTIITGVMVFLSVLSLSVVLALSGAVLDWKKEWQNNATIQIIPSFNTDIDSLEIRHEKLQEVFKNNESIIKKTTLLSNSKKESLIKPWVLVSSNLSEYMPIMYDVEFKEKVNKSQFIKQVENISQTRFMSHQKWHNEMNELSRRIILVAILLFASVFFVTLFSVVYACKTSMEVNKREIEIFDIVGAYDDYIAHQFSKMVLFQTLLGGFIGFIISMPIIGAMISVVSRQQIGLTGLIRAESWHLAILAIIPFIVSLASVHIAKKTTLKKLQELNTNV